MRAWCNPKRENDPKKKTCKIRNYFQKKKKKRIAGTTFRRFAYRRRFESCTRTAKVDAGKFDLCSVNRWKCLPYFLGGGEGSFLYTARRECSQMHNVELVVYLSLTFVPPPSSLYIIVGNE